MDPPSTMAACEKTLGTYELLEGIIAHMDLTAIQIAKRVSRTWLDLIHNSRDIQSAAVLRPITFSISDNVPCDKDDDPDYLCVPWYHTSSSPKLHPSLVPVTEDGTVCDFQGPVENDDCFATFPPCIAIGLHLQMISKEDWPHSGSPYPVYNFYHVVYHRRVVRVRDLWDVQKMVEEQEQHLAHWSSAAYIGFGDGSTRRRIHWAP